MPRPVSATHSGQDVDAKSEKLAFGVEPQSRAYRLRLARYPALAEEVALFVRRRREEGTTGIDLLDLGLGSGRSLRYIEVHDEARWIRFHGIDLSPARLAEVHRPEVWRLIIADAEQGLPFAARTFDTVLCEQVLEHLSEPGRVLSDIARVLRPGGLLIAGVPIFAPGIRGLRRLAVSAIEKLRGARRGHAQSFTAREFVNLVRASGPLEVLRWRGFRIVSGGLLAPLEEHRWWWRLNRSVGAAVPSLCTEVQVVARRTH